MSLTTVSMELFLKRYSIQNKRNPPISVFFLSLKVLIYFHLTQLYLYKVISVRKVYISLCVQVYFLTILLIYVL